MTNDLKLESAFRFPERILLFGGGGAGKTHAALSIASRVARGHIHILDCDVSGAYDRAIAVDHPDVESRATITRCSDWADYIGALETAVRDGDPEHDWIIVDPHSVSWDWVQDHILGLLYGDDLVGELIQLKKDYADDAKGYHAAKSNMMNWDLVKKEYNRAFAALQRWNGHVVLVCEAKELYAREDEQTKSLYGPLGVKPAGNARNRHVTSTTLYLDHPSRDRWRVTTVKDRNREELDKVVVDDFAMDYLMGVAGWRIARGAEVDA